MNTSILFLCTGNICRSPVAEAVARQLYRHLPVAFSSAGLAASVGLPASTPSAAYGLATGAPLEEHRSRPVSPEVARNAAWVIGMTRSHAALFRSRFGAGYPGMIGVLGAPGVDLGRMAHSPEVEEVPDPYGGSDEKYRVVCEQIRTLVGRWEPWFRELAERKDELR